jgi:ABC-type sugar transport system ATPase subunit
VAEIRLENVTKVFKPGGRVFQARGNRGTFSSFEDKAFVERVQAHQEENAAITGDGPVVALDHLNLTINDGETMACVGPSGCGKSTLLRVVAGLEPMDEGNVYFDGKLMNEVSPKDRGIGMVFQNYALYPHMESEGNLAFFFKVRKRPSEEMMERIRITSEIMGIGFEQLLSRKPGQLSGGQQQRVAIGRCIVRDPSLFLFDEPLSNLDAKLRSSTRIEIRRLVQRFAITAIYVTHDQVEAITLGDRIAVMRQGKIEQLGTYQDIISKPVNSFVAGFVGIPPMNLLPGWRVTSDGELDSDIGRIPVPAHLLNLVQRDQKVVLGFHSEDARVIPEGEPTPEGDLVIRTEVLNSSPNFAQRHQLVNVQARDLIFGVQAPLEMRLNTGFRVNIVIPAERAYLFDEQTEARLAEPGE